MVQTRNATRAVPWKWCELVSPNNHQAPVLYLTTKIRCDVADSSEGMISSTLVPLYLITGNPFKAPVTTLGDVPFLVALFPLEERSVQVPLDAEE